MGIQSNSKSPVRNGLSRLHRSKIEVCAGLALAILVSGCQTVAQPRPGEAAGATRNLRNNAYSLLYELLNEERHVSTLLIIKRDRRVLNALINQISDAAASGADSLKAFAKKDPSLDLAVEGLPPGETATRQAIAATKRKQLLGTSGEEFERALLLTQMEALNYAAHLAAVAAKHDSDPNRSGYLATLSQIMSRLHSQVFGLLFGDPPRRLSRSQEAEMSVK